MKRNQKLIAAKAAAVMAAVPFLIWAHEYGPDPGYCGVPKENPSCIASQCHVGTANDPNNKGSVQVTFAGGKTWSPGVKQHLVVTIDDPTQRAWGFQLTARLAGNSATMAGSFAFTDADTQLMCATANLQQLQAQCLNKAADSCTTAVPTCPSNMPLQYMEHTLTGYNARKGKTGPQTFEFDWTPPASASGDIDFYLAGNAANGDLTERGDHIYTKKITLPVMAPAGTPTLSANVVNGASFQPGITPGSWFTVFGTNFVPAGFVDDWSQSIVNGKLPTALDGVSIDVGGKPAYINVVTATQINAIAPDAGDGSVSMTVTTPGGTTSAVSATSQQFSPAFFLWPGNQVVATYQDFNLAVKAGTFAGANTVAAKPGDVVILWGTGFGPTSPAVTPGIQVPGDQTYSTANNVTVTINNTPATVFGTALAPGFAGLYQVAIQVPASLADGDWPIKASIGSFQSPDGAVLSVKK